MSAQDRGPLQTKIHPREVPVRRRRLVPRSPCHTVAGVHARNRVPERASWRAERGSTYRRLRARPDAGDVARIVGGAATPGEVDEHHDAAKRVRSDGEPADGDVDRRAPPLPPRRSHERPHLQIPPASSARSRASSSGRSRCHSPVAGGLPDLPRRSSRRVGARGAPRRRRVLCPGPGP